MSPFIVNVTYLCDSMSIILDIEWMSNILDTESLFLPIYPRMSS